jgi:tetraacyldisaccharide 4'-kinase
MSTSFRTLSGDTIDSAALRSRRGAAFAGIASPGQFFSDLKSLALNIEKSETFRDHVNYGKMELGRLRRLASGADYLVTTEKDAVKLRQEDLSVVCYVAPLTVDFFAPEKLETWLENLF